MGVIRKKESVVKRLRARLEEIHAGVQRNKRPRPGKPMSLVGGSLKGEQEKTAARKEQETMVHREWQFKYIGGRRRAS